MVMVRVMVRGRVRVRVRPLGQTNGAVWVCSVPVLGGNGVQLCGCLMIKVPVMYTINGS